MLKLPTTVEMQLALVAGMRAMVAVILRAGDPGSPLARRRALDAVTGAGERGYDEDALEADLAEPADGEGPRSSRSAASSRWRRASGAWPRPSGSRWRTAR